MRIKEGGGGILHLVLVDDICTWLQREQSLSLPHLSIYPVNPPLNTRFDYRSMNLFSAAKYFDAGGISTKTRGRESNSTLAEDPKRGLQN
jgi:hypothetical protein